MNNKDNEITDKVQLKPKCSVYDLCPAPREECGKFCYLELDYLRAESFGEDFEHQAAKY
jgi:hypothetical protein